jgi:signal transduction histidine kinase/CheY-like chemotaxis protein
MIEDIDPETNAGAVSQTVERILVVDDDLTICNLCSRKLRATGYDVVATGDANEAMRALHSGKPFDLLLADILMPEISGLELAQYAHSADPAIAVILMTGDASNEHLHQAARSDIADFLKKPFELDDLQQAVGQALHKRNQLRTSLRLQALEHLLYGSNAINATLDRWQLGRTILHTAMQSVDCPVGFLLIGDDQGRLNEILASDETWQISEPGYQAACEVYQNGQPRALQGGVELCRKAEAIAGYGLAVALQAQGQIAGVLLLCDTQDRCRQSGVREMIGLLANQAGTALRNAYHYGKLQDAYQQLQELDRLKSEFIAIASHELRSPLAIVLGYTMMLRDDNDGVCRQYAERVLDSARHIKDLVDGMVSLRHLELHNVRPVPEPCLLQALIEPAIERMTTLARQRDQELLAEISDPEVPLLADRDKLLIVLSNLISNAVKFTRPGGRVCVKAGIWPVAEVQSALATAGSSPLADVPAAVAHMVVVQVCDSGIGIPLREQTRIFERFYQIAESLTREHGGTGLGLSLVRDLVEVQGGVLWLNSTEGMGSTFAFAFPLRSP